MSKGDFTLLYHVVCPIHPLIPPVKGETFTPGIFYSIDNRNKGVDHALKNPGLSVFYLQALFAAFGKKRSFDG
jgi:hypothetical protein